jgi:hypothetical protein
MLLLDPDLLDSQRIGRMGELVVELELIARGWHVGNFNATTNNSAGWDLFATRDDRSVKLRVKAKRPGTECFRWSAKPSGAVFLGLSSVDLDDFVAAVNFLPAGGYEIYNVPAVVVEQALRENHASYIAAPKRSGEARKDGSQRNLYLDDASDRLAHGYAKLWHQYRSNWAFDS